MKLSGMLLALALAVGSTSDATAQYVVNPVPGTGHYHYVPGYYMPTSYYLPASAPAAYYYPAVSGSDRDTDRPPNYYFQTAYHPLSVVYPPYGLYHYQYAGYNFYYPLGYHPFAY